MKRRTCLGGEVDEFMKLRGLYVPDIPLAGGFCILFSKWMLDFEDPLKGNCRINGKIRSVPV